MDAFFVIKRARDGTRTRDPDLGKVVLHQLKLERTSPAGLVYHKEGIQMDAFFVIKRARDGTRTRDPDLGKVVLHQLSHSRIYD